MAVKRVYIVGNDTSCSEYSRMFKGKSWQIASHIWEADLLQFTGGADVSSIYYNQKQHLSSSSYPIRDRKEKLIFMLALKDKIPMAGICRGGQFLNVMNGGWMWQDCNNHATGKMHAVNDLITGETFNVTSTHHQMMEPHPTGMVIGLANESTWKEKMEEITEPARKQGIRELCPVNTDVEIVFYSETNCFCFQPHPEFTGYKDLANRYFGYLNDYLGV